MAAREDDRDRRGARSRRDDGSPTTRRPERARRSRPPVSARPRRTEPGPASRVRGLWGLTSTRRAAVLAMVVCALALSIAVPLQTYLAQRSEVQAQLQRQQVLRKQVADLQAREAQLADPAQVEAEARDRLRYVMPGETPYVVQLPGQVSSSGKATAKAPATPDNSWYDQLWNTISGSNG